MIELHRTRTAHGEVSIALHSRDGAVGYLKNGRVQTLIDARGRNLAVHVDAAVELLKECDATRVLGHGGGAASTMVHREGMDVVSVDCDPCAERLARLFFRAPPCLDVVVDDAANDVGRAAPASFDAVLVDFQDSEDIPVAYLSERFWRASVRLLRPRGMLLANITEWLHLGPDWLVFRGALAAAGLGAVSLSEDFGTGNRLLIFSSVS
jgi:spermidine synthase